MIRKEEKEKRKTLLREAQRQENERILASVPINKEDLTDLFDWIDKRLIENGCDHTLLHTLKFIEARKLPQKTLIDWLEIHGGYCDCEVIANVEDKLTEIFNKAN